MGGGAADRIGLDPAHRILERQTLAGDLGFTQCGLHAAQLGNQRRPRAFIERTALLAGSTGIQSGDGAGYERVVISHPRPVCRILGKPCT
jgi:hypothetical protein